MTMPAKPLHIVRLHAPADAVSLLFESLPFPDDAPTATLDVESGLGTLDFYVSSPADGEIVRARLESAAGELLAPPAWRIELVQLAEADWAEEWKKHFHVEHVSDRIVIRPSWEEYTPRAGENVITLDPGMCFGTGRHGTTRACIQFLDRLQRRRPDASVLDMGCGSGILSIAAATLGFARVAGFDNAPEAVVTARENALRNGAPCEFFEADVTALRDGLQADIVLANILAEVLTEAAARVSASVAPGGNLVLAGILTTQYPAVRAAFVAQGFGEEDTITIDEWTSGLFRDNRRPPVAR
jgi:ribosomal protein L11 methyltransferase